MKRALSIALRLILAALVLVLAVIGFLTITHGTPVHRVLALGDPKGPPAVGDSLFVRTMSLMTGIRIDSGSTVDLMTDGEETYPQLWRDLRSARQTITMQMYYSLPGQVADSVKSVLSDMARKKVRVLLLLDAFGSQHLLGDWADSLRKAGVEIGVLRPLRWYTLNKANNRSHVRVVVVDGKVAYTGGFGIADYWLGNGHAEDQWRDSNVRFTGPAVAQLQAAFAAGWAEATGVLLTGELFFPPQSFEPAGPARAGVFYSMPTTGSTPAERFLVLSIAGARKTLYIENSYFVPDDDFRNLLIAAARHGVDVRILTVSEKTDVKTTYWAGRWRYEPLLENGVRIYEYQPTMMHAKTIVVDGLWSSVGSLNFDNRSLAFNNESNLCVLDSAVGAKMDSIFFADLRYSKEIKLDEFRKRSWTKKVVEWGANALSRVL